MKFTLEQSIFLNNKRIPAGEKVEIPKEKAAAYGPGVFKELPITNEKKEK